MAHPARTEKAEYIVEAIEQMLAAYVARYVHMSTNDEPLAKARQELIDALAEGVR